MSSNLKLAGILLLAGVLLSGCSSARKSSTGSSREDQLRSEIVQFAQQQLGKPYKYAGRSPKQGFDCSGFTHYVLDRFNIVVSPASRLQAREGRKVDPGKVRPGDIIYYKRSPTGPVFHVSLVVGNENGEITVIHSVSRGVTQENISRSSYWKPKVYGARNVISP